jgi:SAM-dependent methyltransferase
MQKLYSELAYVWDILTPPDVYREEAKVYWDLINHYRNEKVQSLCELGSGGGYLASHFPESLNITLVDSSPEMLALSKQRNPKATHICADMVTVKLEEQLDVVIVHDSIMYLHDETQLVDFLKNARSLLKENGSILIVPDITKDEFFENIVSGDAQNDQRHVFLTEWRYMPEPDKSYFEVAFSLLIKENDTVSPYFETHKMGCFSMSEWMAIFKRAKLIFSPIDIFMFDLPRQVFLLKK